MYTTYKHKDQSTLCCNQLTDSRSVFRRFFHWGYLYPLIFHCCQCIQIY